MIFLNKATVVTLAKSKLSRMIQVKAAMMFVMV